MVGICPRCNANLRLIKRTNENYYSCFNYPKCTYKISEYKYLEFKTKKINEITKNKKNILKEMTPYLEAEINDVVVLKDISTNEIIEYKLVQSYVEYNDVFIGFGKYGAKHNHVLNVVEGGNPNHLTDPSISIQSPIGKMLLGNRIGNNVSFNDTTFLILDIKKRS